MKKKLSFKIDEKIEKVNVARKEDKEDKKADKKEDKKEKKADKKEDKKARLCLAQRSAFGRIETKPAYGGE